MSGPVESITLGCRLNAHESGRMVALARAASQDDLVIVNTCAVTRAAVRQSRQAIRRARRDRPGARIAVTGCAAEIDPAGFADMPEVDRVIGNRQKTSPATWGAPRIKTAPLPAVTPSRPRRARAYVEAQNGCDHRCTFCIIPYGRGDSRSTPIPEAVEVARQLTAAGYAEVVLTGVDLTAYGMDLPDTPRLGTLVEAILDGVPELPRLRLSSIDVAEVDPLLAELIASEPRLMPHLHLSLQAGDDMILKRMKRRHSRKDAVRFCERIGARRDIAFGADLIAGFPTETPEMFGNTLRLVEDCDLSYLHVFPFSARPGTPAARMPQLPGDTIRARAAQLRQAGEDRLRRRLASRVGRREDILVESPVRGRTECYAPVVFSAPRMAEEIGGIVRAKITAPREDCLVAG